MEIRKYETVYVIAPDLTEEETEQIIARMEEIVKQNGGKDVEINRWGKRQLAYEIKHYTEGYYVVMRYSTEGGTGLVHELERRMKNHEKILRFLTVRYDLELKKPMKVQAKWERKKGKLTQEMEASGEEERVEEKVEEEETSEETTN